MPVDMKSLIGNTFEEMMEYKSIDKITIKDLVDACNISRQAFYYHFRDIMDVVKYKFEKDMRTVLANSLNTSSLEEALQIFILEISKRKTIIQKQVIFQRKEEIAVIALEVVNKYLQELFRKKVLKKKISYEELDVIVDFYSCGITTFLLKQYEKEQVDEKKLAYELSKIISVGIMPYEI